MHVTNYVEKNSTKLEQWSVDPKVIALLNAHLFLQVVGGGERSILVDDAAKVDHQKAEARG